MYISEAVVKRIEFLCKERGISINKLATLSGLTQSTIDSIVKGKSRNPRLATLRKICTGLNVSMSEFFDDPTTENADYD
jgi:transcriptional regulator with XRE-family HTH domain